MAILLASGIWTAEFCSRLTLTRSESCPSSWMFKSCCMSSAGKSDRRWPVMVCWLFHSLVPASLMFSEPETLIAGPPGPSRLCTRLGSGEGNSNERPGRAGAAPWAPGPALMLVRERSVHSRWKFCHERSRPYWSNGTRTGSPNGTSPISGTALRVPESGSTLTSSRRWSLAIVNRASRSPSRGSAANTNWSSMASRENDFQAGGRVSTAALWGRWSLESRLRPGMPGSPISRPTSGRVRARDIQLDGP